MSMEVVYVIYFDGKRYDNYSRRIAYLSEASARKVVTCEAKSKARVEYSGNKDFEEGWYALPLKQQKEFTEKMKERFEIIHFVPRVEGGK